MDSCLSFFPSFFTMFAYLFFLGAPFQMKKKVLQTVMEKLVNQVSKSKEL